MKRFILIAVLLFACFSTGHAVLRERNLEQTLKVLRAELKADVAQQQKVMEDYNKKGTKLHEQLAYYMSQCEQLGLMMYSQDRSSDFASSYVCSQTLELYQRVKSAESEAQQYEKMLEYTDSEIKRHQSLIITLKSMPPIKDEFIDEVLTKSDSILYHALDSLAHTFNLDVDLAGGEPGVSSVIDDSSAEAESYEYVSSDPLYLTGEMLVYRDDCLKYAMDLIDDLEMFRQRLESDKVYYDNVREKVEYLNADAEIAFKKLQRVIFVDGDEDYFSVLVDLPTFIKSANKSIRDNYMNFPDEKIDSDWRGMSVLYVSIFFSLYFIIIFTIVYFILKFIFARFVESKKYKQNRIMITNLVATGLMIIIYLFMQATVDDNYMVRLSIKTFLRFLWFVEVVFLSLYFRLDSEDMEHGALLYRPFMFLSFLLILLRVTVAPDSLINIIFPPVILGLTVIQIRNTRKNLVDMPLMDVVFATITCVIMGISTVISWLGYNLLSIQILVWWCFQITYLLTISCALNYINIRRETIFRKEWLYRLLSKCFVPVLIVLSLPYSILHASKMFEMRNFVEDFLMRDFITQENLISISVQKIILAICMWFIFSYVNYIFKLCYDSLKAKKVSGELVQNSDLSKNIISILVWGLYFITILVLFNVPKNGISLVTAGLATGLGFAMKDLIENFVYGMQLMAGRMKVGDVVECDGITGHVVKISYQTTLIETFDGCIVAFLNSALFKQNFQNMTRNGQFVRLKIPIGVAYGSDVEKSREVILKALVPLRKMEDEMGRPYVDPAHSFDVFVNDLGDSSVNFEVRVWAYVMYKTRTKSLTTQLIYEALNAEGISIPFPQRDIHIIQDN